MERGGNTYRCLKCGEMNTAGLPQRDALELQAGADTLLFPGKGGIAIWVRRDELQPRCAVRLRTEEPDGEDVQLGELLTLLATLHVGVLFTAESLGRQMGLDPETVRGMLNTAVGVVEPRMRAMTQTLGKDGKPL